MGMLEEQYSNKVQSKVSQECEKLNPHNAVTSRHFEEKEYVISV